MAPGSTVSTLPGYDRRAFLLTSLGAAAVGLLAGAAGRSALTKRLDVSASRAAVVLPPPVSPAPALPAGTDLGLPGLSPFRTPNQDFYRIDTALLVPQVSTDDWRLRVFGLVDREIELDYAGLLARGLVERDITLTCVSNEVGGSLVGSAGGLARRSPTCCAKPVSMTTPTSFSAARQTA